MTMNGSWGYQKADDDWKTPKTIVRNLITCARDTGNYLLNIGPKPDGSIPEESVRILTAVGKWMDRNGTSIYQYRYVPAAAVELREFHAQGQHAVHARAFLARIDGSRSAGLMNQVKSARMLATGQEVKFDQDKFRVRFLNLPANAPDDPVTTIAIECDGEPRQDTDFVRRERPRTQLTFRCKLICA